MCTIRDYQKAKMFQWLPTCLWRCPRSWRSCGRWRDPPPSSLAPARTPFWAGFHCNCRWMWRPEMKLKNHENILLLRPASMLTPNMTSTTRKMFQWSPTCLWRCPCSWWSCGRWRDSLQKLYELILAAPSWFEFKCVHSFTCTSQDFTLSGILLQLPMDMKTWNEVKKSWKHFTP